MPLILIRHCDKEFATHGDPALSEYGNSQAMAILSLFQNSTLPKPQEIWVSQKIRTLQSVKPSSDFFNIKPNTLSELNERSRGESHQEFFHRIHSLITKIEQLPSDINIVICSHFDWIDVFLSEIRWKTQPQIESWQSAQWATIQFKPDWLIQKQGIVTP